MPEQDTLITDIQAGQFFQVDTVLEKTGSIRDSIFKVFDSYLKNPAIFVEKQTEPIVGMPSSDRSGLLEEAYKGAIMQDWTIGLFVVLVLILASIKITNSNYFGQLFKTSFDKKSATRFFNEKRYSFFHESFRMDVLSIFSLSIIMLHTIRNFEVASALNNLTLLLYCFLSLAMLMIAKNILYRLTGLIFQTVNEVDEYLFYHQTGIRISGLVLMPFGFVLYFTKGFTDEAILVLCALTILFFSAIALMRGLRIIHKKVFSIYYPILYLCTLEISPLIITWVVLMGLI